MTRRSTPIIIAVLGCSAALLSSCVQDTSFQSQAANLALGECSILDRTGGVGVPEDLSDQLATRIRKSAKCPVSFRDVIETLTSATQPEGLTACTNLRTRIVETQAQHLQSAFNDGLLVGDDAKIARLAFGGPVPELGGYHTVTSVDCGGDNAKQRILFLQSRQFNGQPITRAGEKIAVNPTGQWEDTGLRKPFEAIAWDPKTEPVSGVFNYYAVEPKEDDDKTLPCAAFGGCKPFEWAFHGDSRMFLAVNDKLEPTAVFSKDKQERRCGVCHTGGGLIMRELDSPWINWENDFNTPGSSDLIKTHAKVLGTKVGGINQETKLVRPGNELWDAQRIKLVSNPALMPSPAIMLKPLFCTNELNIQSQSSSTLSSVPSDFFLDPTLEGRSNESVQVSIDNAIYKKAINCDFDPATKRCKLATGQIIPNLTFGTDKLPAFGIIDTAGAFMAPERAAADSDYVDRLEAAKLIDKDLVTAVLGVDFTRPIFSSTRCDILIELNLTWADLGGAIAAPETVRTVIESKLTARKDAGTLSAGGAELLDNLIALKPDSGKKSVTTRVADFAKACSQRATDNPEAMMADILVVANVYREKAYARPLFAFIPTSMPIGIPEALMPAGTSRPADARLNPADCTLEKFGERQAAPAQK